MMFKTASLPPHILHVVADKGTEQAFSGEYDNGGGAGTYLCRKCGLGLFRSAAKFHSGCGWPSFDLEIPNAIARKRDADGKRTEILCARCEAHLGHVFTGEGFTPQQVRHCVNSLSLDFVTDLNVTDTEEVIVAAGCFWGVEHYFQQLAGVLKTEVGYTGGEKAAPTYEEVCTGRTGHYEAIRIIYDPLRINCEKIFKYFFEIHDATQTNGQGPDLGQQYLSVIFYYNDAQKQTAIKLIAELKSKNYLVTTQLLPVKIFWHAEKYHQDYYVKTGKKPYCHFHVKRF